MRILIGPDDASLDREDVDDDALARLYAPPRPDWWRASMVATTDGAASGPDGLSGSINNAPDGRVFAALRAHADAIVVGAGTVRAEEYGPADVPIVCLTRGAEVPPSLADAPDGTVLLRSMDDPAALRAELSERGLMSVTVEGGPSVLATLLAAGVVDELCLTTVPRLLGGDAGRITAGTDVDLALSPTLLLEHDGTLLGRWEVRR
ncbi:dihydrofolate reductase family protein [Nocardioides sp. CFH 31398]|uniref:dihydrofolate reductase family protein n=1 Tax=Nocardioides sp. CFH 31398 TaxID=2919579 RepID=UPI001F056488|nr:dihydrofolate reductase family protein [Nocardioides sp. CFH 31398]MCH1865964.1 dihydrofolate reductase family protein [Nocardioides sp. CFH 31398]